MGQAEEDHCSPMNQPHWTIMIKNSILDMDYFLAKMTRLTMILGKKASVFFDRTTALLLYSNARLSNICSVVMRSFFSSSKSKFPI